MSGAASRMMLVPRVSRSFSVAIVHRLLLQIDLFSLAGARPQREPQRAGPRRAVLLLAASSVQTKINCIPDVLVQVLCRPAHAAWCPRLGPVSALAPSPAQTAPILPSRPASTATPRAQQSRIALLCARALVPRPWLVLVAHILLCSCVQLSRSALLLHISHPHVALPLQGAGRGSGAVAGCRGKRQAAVAAGGRVVVTTTAAGARAQADAGGGVVGHKGLELGGSAGECGRREPAKAREQAARSAGGWTHACFLFVLCVCAMCRVDARWKRGRLTRCRCECTRYVNSSILYSVYDASAHERSEKYIALMGVRARPERRGRRETARLWLCPCE